MSDQVHLPDAAGMGALCAASSLLVARTSVMSKDVTCRACWLHFVMLKHNEVGVALARMAELAGDGGPVVST